MYVADIIPKKFKAILFSLINIKYKKNTSFTHIFFYVCINNKTSIIIDLDNISANEPILLQEDMQIN